MSDWLPVAVLLVPLVTAITVFLAPRSRPVRGAISIGGATLLLAASIALLAVLPPEGVIALHMGGWAAPFGITLVVDSLSAMLVLVTAIIALGVTVHALGDIGPTRAAAGFDGFLQLLLTGVVGAFITGDLFNLYVWFEVMLIASFALMTVGGTRRQLDAAVKYIAINLVSTVLLLTAIGLTYGVAGTLDLADLHRFFSTRPDDGTAGVIAAFFLVAFGIKAAIFPLFFWLPASYHTLPVSVSAVFAGLMTKVGIYALLRLSSMLFPGETEAMRGLLLGLAFATIVAGLAGAIAETGLRRLLSWLVVSSIGFLLLGIALGTEAALGAAVFYMVHAMLVKTVLFLIAGLVARDPDDDRLAELGGLWQQRPWLALAFLAAALSLMGLPPFSGFWAKLALLEAGLDARAWYFAAGLLVTSVFVYVPLAGVWQQCFWKAAPESPGPSGPPGSHRSVQPRRDRGGALLSAPVAVLGLVVLIIGLVPGPLLALSARAAAGLQDPSAYVRAVLGPSTPSTAASSATSPAASPAPAPPSGTPDENP